MHEIASPLLAGLVILALMFDFLNGLATPPIPRKPSNT